MKNSDNKTYIYAIGIIAFCVILYITRHIITPFAIAFIIAYALDPLVDKMESWKLPRSVAIIFFLLFILFALTLIGLIIFPLIKFQIEKLIADMPDYIKTFERWFSPFFENFIKDNPIGIKETVGNSMKKLANIPLHIYSSATSILWTGFSGILNFIIAAINLIIIPISCFYLLKDIDIIKEKIRGLIPRQYKNTLSNLFEEINSVLSGFIRGQLIVSSILALFYCVGLFLVGAPMSILLGIVAGFANIVPYLGLIIGLLPALLLTFLQFHDLTHVAGVLLVFALAQALEGMVITPRIVGDKIGLHPVVIMLAILVGGSFFGFTGIILAVPAAAVLNVFIKHGIDNYKKSALFLLE